MCNCKLTEIVVAAVILVFALYEATYSKWIIIIAAVVLFVHGLMCKDIACCNDDTAKPKAKKKRR